jgi:hypothetical protein
MFCPSRAPFLPSSRPALLPRAFCPEPVLYWPVFCPSRAPFLPSSRPALLPRARVVRARVLLHVCPHARTPARLLACASHARPPSRPPASLACLPARLYRLYRLYRCAPARLHQPVSPVPCPARPPPVLACPPACLRSTCLRARPHTNVACPPLDRPTARRRRPALLPAARLPVRPPACLPPACSPAHPPACLPSVYEPHANADATRATLRPRWLHTPAPHPRPFPPCTATPHHRRTAAYVRRGGRCVLWP